jgi:hypothetical protein
MLSGEIEFEIFFRNVFHQSWKGTAILAAYRKTWSVLVCSHAHFWVIS